MTGAAASTADLVRALWQRFAERDWAGAAILLSPSFRCDWPQSGERFDGAAAFLAMNEAHPAPNWRISEVDVVAAVDGRAVARVLVATDAGVDVGLGWYTSAAGRLTSAVEYWTEHAQRPTPDWRAAWTTRIDG